MLLTNICNNEHIWALRFLFEKVTHMFRENCWCERAERLPVLDLEIHDRLHLGTSGITNDRPRTQSSWAEFHRTLKPTHDLLVSQNFRKPGI